MPPAPVGLRVEGGRQLRRVLRRAGGRELMRALSGTHRKIAQMIAGSSRAAAPHRTGRLAASVRGGGTQTGAVVRAGSARVPYAGPIHWGWPARKIKPNPWIVETAQSTESAWVGVYEQDLNDIIERLPNE